MPTANTSQLQKDTWGYATRWWVVFLLRLSFIILAFSFLVISGCAASLSDFQEMTFQERANYACSESQQIKSLNKRLESVQLAISDTENAISRGYRIHRACHQIPSVVPIMNCGIYSCYTTTRTVYNTVCNSNPVAIDGDIEEKKLKSYRATQESVENSYYQEYNECYYKLIKMKAEDAFNYYKANQ